jgi:glycosyltransferase involved in cell wall biosynthesis
LNLEIEVPQKIKVLFLYWHLDYGGAEVGLLTTLRHINRERFQCTVLCMEKKGPIGVEIEKLGIKVIYLNSAPRLFNIILVWKVFCILRKLEIDILHTSLFYANFFGRVASLTRKIPITITEERSMYYEKKIYHVWIDRLLARFTDKIIVCSMSVLNFTMKQEKIPFEKFYLIYNGVDEDRFSISSSKSELRRRYGFSADQFIIGTVGSIIPKKGHKFLIEAARNFCPQMPDCKVLIVGEGSSKKDLEDLVQKENLTDFFVFMGARKDIPELMKLMDVFVLSSLQEGFPRVLVEAMYMGLPVIASSVSGVPELVLDGETGFLVPPGNSKSICEKVLILNSDNDLRNKMGTKARERIQERFLSKHYLNKLEALYDDLITQKISNKNGRFPR